MIEQLSSPSKSLMIPVYVDNIAHAQVAILTPTLCTKSRKFNPNVEVSFHLKASKDKWGHIHIWLLHPRHAWLDLILFDWILFEPVIFSHVTMIGILAFDLKLYNWWTLIYTFIYASNPKVFKCTFFWIHSFIFNLKPTTILKFAYFDFKFGVRHSLDYVDFLWTLHCHMAWCRAPNHVLVSYFLG